MIMIRKNPNKEIADDIAAKLKANNGYCPCQIGQTPETRCLCKLFQDQIAENKLGFCHCGLWEAFDDELEKKIKDNEAARADALENKPESVEAEVEEEKTITVSNNGYQYTFKKKKKHHK